MDLSAADSQSLIQEACAQLASRPDVLSVTCPLADFAAAQAATGAAFPTPETQLSERLQAWHQGAFSTDLAQKSRTYSYVENTYNCMGGARSSFRRLTCKYCVLDPSETSFSQILPILHTLLSLIFFRVHRNTVECAEQLYIHLHSNSACTCTGTAAVHTFLHTNWDPDLVGFMSQQCGSPLLHRRGT